MTKAHRLKTRKGQDASLSLGLSLNFLLGCSQDALDNYALARLGDIADTRKEMLAVMDRLILLTAQNIAAEWFKRADRDSINRDLATEESPLEWAKRKISEGRRGEERLEDDFLPGLPLGAAHLAAAQRYQQRNKAEGKCRYCPKPLAHGSVDVCEEHLAKQRVRDRTKKGLTDPGSREYLYAGEIPESTHGRQPGTLASLAMSREKKTRAMLAELGIPPESAAVSLKAAVEALLKCMPHSKVDAITQAQLFEKAGVVTKTTGQKALQQLLYTGETRRIGKGGPLDPYRYFQERQNAPTEPFEKSGEEPTQKSKHLSRTKQNSALLKTMRGEEGKE